MGYSTMTLGELREGQFAITNKGMAVLGLSRRSFQPIEVDYANVVHIANGIGAFLKTDKCEVVTPEQAFEAAREYESREN